MGFLSVSDSVCQTSGALAYPAHGWRCGTAKQQLATRKANGGCGGEDATEVAAGATDNHGSKFRGLQVEVEAEQANDNDFAI